MGRPMGYKGVGDDGEGCEEVGIFLRDCDEFFEASNWWRRRRGKEELVFEP